MEAARSVASLDASRKETGGPGSRRTHGHQSTRREKQPEPVAEAPRSVLAADELTTARPVTVAEAPRSKLAAGLFTTARPARGPPGEPASATAAPLSRAVVIGGDAQLTTAQPGALTTAPPGELPVTAAGASSREEEEASHAELDLAGSTTTAPDVDEVASSREEEETSDKVAAEQAAAPGASSRKEEVAIDEAPLPKASLVETGPGAAALVEKGPAPLMPMAYTGRHGHVATSPITSTYNEHLAKRQHRHDHEEGTAVPLIPESIPVGVSTRREKPTPVPVAVDHMLNLTVELDHVLHPPAALNLTEALNRTASMLEKKAKGDADSTLAIPRYVYQLPIPLDFLKEGDGYKLRLLERFTVPVLLPWWLAYTYVPIVFTVFAVLWGLCCRKTPKFDLGIGVLCETMFCFMCMWAHRVSTLQLITARRAWGWVLGLAAILSGWHIVDAGLKATNASEATIETAFYVFQGTFLVMWLGFATERMQIRKMMRRTADPMAGDAQCGDCTVELCCPQLTALQETVFLSNQGNVDPKTALSTSKSGGNPSSPAAQNPKFKNGQQPQLW